MFPAQDRTAAPIVRLILPRPSAGARGPSRRDIGLAVGVLLLQTLLALVMSPADGNRPDLLGWVLLSASAVVLVGHRRVPWITTVVVLLLSGPYHALDYVHTAAIPAGVLALFSLALAGPPVRTCLTLIATLSIMISVMLGAGDPHEIPQILRSSGWLVAVILVGEAVRIHRDYVAAVVERAERAERTREEEAARRVAEERLRIARDLHDLLAHSITLIGVRTSVAAHVLVADPERLDRDAVAEALDDIAETCRGARSSLRTTLEVLRAGESSGPSGASDHRGASPDHHEPLPGLAGVPDLLRSAEGAGAHVACDIRGFRRDGGPAHDMSGRLETPDVALPAAVDVAAYRIVQEALTNVVRHANAGVAVRVTVEPSERGGEPALRIVVHDDGGSREAREGPPTTAPEVTPRRRPTDTARVAPGGFGIVGMRERARSVGGRLEAGPSSGTPGYTVTALLPLAPQTAPSERPPSSAQPRGR